MTYRLPLRMLVSVALVSLFGAAAVLAGNLAARPRIIERSMKAEGLLRGAEGEPLGKWSARLTVDEGGATRGSIQFSGVGDDAAHEIEGTISAMEIALGVVRTKAEPGDASDEVCTFDGKVEGVRVTGTFTGLHGLSGSWEGWLEDIEEKRADEPVVISH